jgi:NAD+ diphosphatase
VSWSGPVDAHLGGEPRLSRGRADRAAELRGDAAAVVAAWAAGRVRLLTLGTGTTLPVGQGPTLRFDEPLPWQQLPGEHWLIGRLPEGELVLAVLDETVTGRSLLEVGAELSDLHAGLATTAVALAAWHVGHRFCPVDGAPTVTTNAGWTRVCTACATEHFPRSDPAVIVLVTSPDGGMALLGRAPRWPEGQFSTLAGFVEAGESAEQCVVREIAEETGISVRQVRPVVTQPWPFPRSLMLGYRAVADTDAVPEALDGELAEVAWFSREDILAGVVKVPPAISVAHHLIAGWLAETAGGSAAGDGSGDDGG